MKRAILLCAVIGLTYLVGACTNQPTDRTTTNRNSGFYRNGDVAPINGGGAGPIAPKQRTQP
ncbi:MAG TPA: hypothetical protein VGL24_06690 [Chthoniobacterales bacterium]|jgi:hypothetical protein